MAAVPLTVTKLQQQENADHSLKQIIKRGHFGQFHSQKQVEHNTFNSMKETSKRKSKLKARIYKSKP